MRLYLYDDNGHGGAVDHGGAEDRFRAAAFDYCGDDLCADNGDGALAVARGPHGKPYFAAPPLRGRVFFSVSHSGGYWAALFHDAEVGLDIEDLGVRGGLTRERMEKIAARFFADDEAAYALAGAEADEETEKSEGQGVSGHGGTVPLCRTDAPRRCQFIRPPDTHAAAAIRERFFRIWTAKEAYVKYTGNGLSEGLQSFSSLDPPGGAGIVTFSPAPGLVCSCCAAGAVEIPELAW
jgi:hypothetical protein